jgi:clan AA aspartic protease (TIGR02281 family)
MKVITIGRDLDNDIVINDTKVSRHHLQIIKEDTGNFRIVDFGSTNGIFVNDRKISREAAISINDVVRIGNSTLSWQNYFADKNQHLSNRQKFIGISVAAVILAVVILSSVLILDKKTTVKMKEENGVCYVPMKINGQELEFVFDTGASSICISTLEAYMLIKNGTLLRGDVIGEEQFVDATGNVSVGARINLHSVQLGKRELKDVEAIVIENPNASCLLGQTVLSRFGAYKIDNAKKEIIFE